MHPTRRHISRVLRAWAAEHGKTRRTWTKNQIANTCRFRKKGSLERTPRVWPRPRDPQREKTTFGMTLPFLKGNFLQSRFRANFFDLKLKTCSRYGLAREKQKTEQNTKRKTKNFRRIFSPNFSANFPCVFSRSENGTRRRKTVSQISTQKFSTA